MKKDEIYFGEQGLTSSSANHLANKAKEYVASLENELANISFVTNKMSLLDSDKERILHIGINEAEMDTFYLKLAHISQAKSLCAWLREAIKAKETLTREVSRKDIKTWCEENDKVFPEFPEEANLKTADDYLATLSVKERNRYFELETYCSVFGKFIHVDGAYYNARKEMNKYIQNPVEVRGEGHDAIVYERTTSVSHAKVEDVFFKLNEKYRGYQAELNGIKHTIDQWVISQNADITADYQKKYEAYKLDNTGVVNEFKNWQSSEKKRIADQKIVIPKSLQGIYEEVNKL